MEDKVKLLELIKEIENTKIELNHLICKKQYNLTNPEVVHLSKLLDDLLSQYHNIK